MQKISRPLVLVRQVSAQTTLLSLSPYTTDRLSALLPDTQHRRRGRRDGGVVVGRCDDHPRRAHQTNQTFVRVK